MTVLNILVILAVAAAATFGISAVAPEASSTTLALSFLLVTGAGTLVTRFARRRRPVRLASLLRPADPPSNAKPPRPGNTTAGPGTNSAGAGKPGRSNLPIPSSAPRGTTRSAGQPPSSFRMGSGDRTIEVELTNTAAGEVVVVTVNGYSKSEFNRLLARIERIQGAKWGSPVNLGEGDKVRKRKIEGKVTGQSAVVLAALQNLG